MLFTELCLQREEKKIGINENGERTPSATVLETAWPMIQSHNKGL